MKRALLLFGIVLVAGFAFFLIKWGSPRHGGRTAHSWIQQLSSDDVTRRWEAGRALQALGSNAVPELVERITVQPSPFRSNVAGILAAHGVNTAPLESVLSVAETRRVAVEGFEALGAGSDAAVAALIGLLTDGRAANHASWALTQMDNRVIPALFIAATNADVQVRRRVLADLGYRHTNAPGVEFVLVDRMRNDPDLMTRSMAGISLGQIPSPSQFAVQALLEAMHDPGLSMIAIEGLGRAETNARPAIPSLTQMLADPGVINSSRAGTIRRALHQIDPDALVRMGISYQEPTNAYE